jgi:Tol biopolymer transport system component
MARLIRVHLDLSELLMTQRRVRLVAGLVALVLPMGAAALPASAATATTPLVAVKHHVLATVDVGAHKAVSFKVLGLAAVPKTGVSAVVLTVAAAKPVASGALTLYAAGAKRPSVLSVSFATGHAASNTVVVVPGKAGKVTAYNGSVGAVHVVATVVGWYRTLTSGGLIGSYFHAVAPRQLTSTLVKKAGSFSLGATGVATVPLAAAKVLLQVSVLNPGGKGGLTVSPAGGTRSKATALAFVPGRSATALVNATPGLKGRLLIVSTAKVAVRVRVDVVGYLLPYNPVAAPTGVSAAAQLNSVLVSWKAPVAAKTTPILSYLVTVADVTNHPIRTTATTGPVTSLVVSGLTNGTVYTFAVQAVTKRGNGPLSTYTAATTPAGLPAAPTNVTAAPSAGAATVTWTAPSANGSPLTHYVVTGAPGGPVTYPATPTTVVISGLTVGQRYTFTVTAQNALGSSPASAPSAAVIVTGGAGTLLTSAVSVDSAEAFHNSDSGSGSVGVSMDGRYVAFTSGAGLSGGTDTNGALDVYLRDRVGGTTTLVSDTADAMNTNIAGDHGSTDPAISSDGSVVAFDSNATNLVAGDTNGRSDVFLRNIAGATTTQLSLSDTGTESATRESYGPAITADGSMVAFASNGDLISADTTSGGTYNIYLLRNLADPTSLIRVSRATDGSRPTPTSSTRVAAPTLSPDGHYVGYSSAATNIVAGAPAGVTQAYAFDTTSLATTLVSVGPGGVAGNGNSTPPVFSADHRYAVFQSDSTNLVPGDTNGKTDVFVRDLLTGTTTRDSLGNDGSQGNDASTAPSISADGTRVLFTSLATNLVVGDTNGVADAFVRYLGTNETVRVSVGAGSAQLGAGVDPASIVGGVGLSGDGKTVLFTSDDALSAADTFGKVDLFAHTLG